MIKKTREVMIRAFDQMVIWYYGRFCDPQRRFTVIK